ncbi:16S rRNA (uracil(1498)-N(3))-methyltransferase [Cellulomonas sp. Sa3CUA2]|uniref:Ribosomal RNA small subunit methyltransferase E n=1 Tax=Cellulomonas avistercoris TaxID=2762242 RepID=A0ABR8QCJ2_9CELL|nr:16S rRNA (uracil(1498)-N(3))-methyltransferase [Cellulomonas avistercoris]MBD7918139.1 16S rRNA (uracil(1498)-N(3))-methyltransferase [Cellulomonas avistercoris]
MSAPVFVVEPGMLDDVRAGGEYLLDGTEGRHAGVVQRRGAGERVDVVDCAGVRLVGRVRAAGADGVRIDVEDVVVEDAPAPRLVLVQALAKGDRDELAIEAATEVGVDVVVPWQAERSVVVWRGERAQKSRARWIGTVRTATKQSRRARMPVVEQALDDAGLVARVGAVVAADGVVVVLHESATSPLHEVALPAGGEVLVVVGPEGGISDREVAALTAAGAVVCRLGPHVLRTSTAGPVALAMLADRLGRWG